MSLDNVTTYSNNLEKTLTERQLPRNTRNLNMKMSYPEFHNFLLLLTKVSYNH